LIRILFLF